MNKSTSSAALLIWLVGSIVAIPSSDVRAQAVPDTLVDRRVRIHLSRQERSLEGAVARQMLRGVLTRANPDSVTIRIHSEATPVVVAINGIYQIDLSRGISRSRSALRRGAWAAAVWTSLGAAFGDEEVGGGTTENILIWAGGGLVLGAVLGALFPEEDWTRVFHR